MKRALTTSATLALLAVARLAEAQGIDQGMPQQMTIPGVYDPVARPRVEATPEKENPVKESRRSVRLFDGRRTGYGYELDVGPIWIRKVEDENALESRQNVDRKLGEISFGTAITTPKKPFFLLGVQKTIVRVMGASSFAWSIFHQDFGGGLMLGPFEPEVRLGLSVLTLDAIKGQFSAELLTPRTSIGLGIHVGNFRLDIKAHSEYLWRWFGPDYLSQGITLGLRLDVPRPKSPFTDARQ